MIINTDVYRCYSVNLQQYLTENGMRYFLIAKDIKSSRTFWAYEQYKIILNDYEVVYKEVII